MIIKILNNLKRPHKIPNKILSKIKLIAYKKKYDKTFFENKQNQIFEKLKFQIIEACHQNMKFYFHLCPVTPSLI